MYNVWQRKAYTTIWEIGKIWADSLVEIEIEKDEEK